MHLNPLLPLIETLGQQDIAPAIAGYSWVVFDQLEHNLIFVLHCRKTIVLFPVHTSANRGGFQSTAMTITQNGIYVLQGIIPAQIAAAPVAVKVIDLYDDNN